MASKRRSKSRTGAIAVVGVCIGVWALYAAQEFLKPIALAMLLCFVLAPASQWLERRLRFNRVLSVVSVTLLTALLMVAVGWVVASQVTELAKRMPEYQGNIERKVDSARAHTGGWMDKAMSMSRALRSNFEKAAAPSTQATQPASQPAGVAVVPGPEVLGREVKVPVAVAPGGAGGAGPASQPAVVRAEVVNFPPPATEQQSSWQSLVAFFSPVLTVLGNGAIVTVFVIFMLIQREDLRDRLIALLSGRRIGLTTEAMDDAASRVSRYLLMLCYVNGSYGLIVAAVLWFIGVPAAALWGLLCAMLRFVPYIGPWIAASFPIMLSLAVGENWSMAFWTLSAFLVIELVSNNVMEPLLYGKGTGVSPVAVIVSAAFWTWLWGAPGLLMATPLTVCVAVAGRHVRALSFLNTLLGDEPALAASQRYYQRLLAKDEVESLQVLRASATESGIVGAYEEVALPALKQAERDARRGWLAPDKFRGVLVTLRAQVEKVSEEHRSRAVVLAAKGQAPANTGEACDLNSQKPTPLPPTAVPAKQKLLKSVFAKRKAQNAAVALREGWSARERKTYPAPFSLPKDVHPKVLILPARDEPDEIAGVMLGKILTASGYTVKVSGTALLAHEMVAEVQAVAPDLVVVSATPPSAVAHARYLLKRLSGAGVVQFGPEKVTVPEGGPETLTVLWSTLDQRKLSRRLSPEEPVNLATSLCGAMECVRQLTARAVTVAASGTVMPGTSATSEAVSAATSITNPAGSATTIRSGADRGGRG